MNILKAVAVVALSCLPVIAQTVEKTSISLQNGEKWEKLFHANIAGTKRSPHVRARVVDGRVLATGIEHGHQSLANSHGNALPFRNGTNFGDGDEFGHGQLSVVSYRALCAIAFYE